MDVEPLPERLALQCLEHSLATLNHVLDRRDPLPRLRFDLRGRCAGQAFAQQWMIRLNGELLRRYREDFVRDTVPHELAHLVAYARHGAAIRPHGPQWRELMRLLGRPPEVCHQYEVRPARQIRRYDYRCSCRRHQLSSIRHRRAERGVLYHCRSCGETLQAC